MKLDLLVATGVFGGAAEKMTSSTRAPSSIACVDPLEAYEELKNRLNGDEVVLIKASRGFALERVVPEFERDFGVATVPGGPGA